MTDQRRTQESARDVRATERKFTRKIKSAKAKLTQARDRIDEAIAIAESARN
jgi:hypothetical protein